MLLSFKENVDYITPNTDNLITEDYSEIFDFEQTYWRNFKRS